MIETEEPQFARQVRFSASQETLSVPAAPFVSALLESMLISLLMADQPSTLKLRLATRADTQAMISVVNAAFAIETFIDGTRTDHERMAEMAKTGEFLVAEEAGRMVGSVYIECRGERGYFGMLAVAPDQQGRGLGRILVQAAESHCREKGCRYMDIKVLSLRPELPPLYQKLGYVPRGTEEFHPSRPLKAGVECQCIIMSKAL